MPDEKSQGKYHHLSCLQKTSANDAKCDEVHPLCGPCRKHCICCYYDRPDPNAKTRQVVSSPSSVSSTTTIDLVARASASPTFTRAPPWFGCPDKPTTDLQLM